MCLCLSVSPKSPEPWYARGLDDGDYAGIDTSNNGPDVAVTGKAGNHTHKVDIKDITATSDLAFRAGDDKKQDADLGRPYWYALCYLIKK